ncbi:MAG: GAF domain-containing sensor histidine kinase [Candidatus Coatesbacteria bacterium]|nr:GAF domain-containing sensor histidine kinase [Candidatus Coatesbacteria bacterium]
MRDTGDVPANQDLRLEKENARLRLLIQINRRLHESLDVDQVLSTIVDVATRSLEAERSTFYVVDHEKGEIWSRIVQGENVQEIRLKIGDGIAGYVAKTGEIVNIADAHQDDRFDPDIDAKTGFRTRSMLCMALDDHDGKRVGVIQVMNKKAGQFTTDDEDYLAALGVQAALSLQNAQYTASLSALSRRNQQLVEVLEQRLRDLQDLKMVSMKHMARGIAHEINNMLAKIKGGAQSLEQTVSELRDLLSSIVEGGDVDVEELEYLVKEGLPEPLSGVLEGSEGIAEIVKRIRGFVRLDQGPVQFADINEDLENVIKVCAADIAEAGITLRKELGDLPRIQCRPRELNMVLSEVLRNAIYYASEGKNASLPRLVLVRTALVDDGRFLEASFLDNGPGIPKESWDHIFDLFYTTKPEGSGYGLGLSECYAVAKRNGGALSVEAVSPEDARDYNTRVVLRLPREPE